MYTSVKAHFENGQVVLDEPINAENGVELIVTFLPSSEKRSKNSFKDMLLDGPTWSEKEYQDFLVHREWMNSSKLTK